MTAWLRLAGRGRLANGSTLVWSVAEGGRGRRWRAETLNADGAVVRAVLLEVGLDGRPARLEVSSAAGMLTLHPESDGRSAHGNVVAADGVRPLVLPWSAEHEIVVAGVPLGELVALRRLARRIGVGEGVEVPVLVIGADLAVRAERRVMRRVTASRWTIDDGGADTTIDVDERGIPVGLDDPDEWPLEES